MGGLECTINRVGDEYLDQLSYCGHYSREGDIDLIAQLASMVAQHSGLDTRRIKLLPTPLSAGPQITGAYTVLKSEKGVSLPKWQDALVNYFAIRAASRRCQKFTTFIATNPVKEIRYDRFR